MLIRAKSNSLEGLFLSLFFSCLGLLFPYDSIVGVFLLDL